MYEKTIAFIKKILQASEIDGLEGRSLDIIGKKCVIQYLDSFPQAHAIRVCLINAASTQISDVNLVAINCEEVRKSGFRRASNLRIEVNLPEFEEKLKIAANRSLASKHFIVKASKQESPIKADGTSHSGLKLENIKCG